MKGDFQKWFEVPDFCIPVIKRESLMFKEELVIAMLC